jgi:hypothetical protein
LMAKPVIALSPSKESDPLANLPIPNSKC